MLGRSPPSPSFLLSSKLVCSPPKQCWLNPSEVPDVFLALPGVGGVLLPTAALPARLPGVCCLCVSSARMGHGSFPRVSALLHPPSPRIDPDGPCPRRPGLSPSPPLGHRLPTPSRSLSLGTPLLGLVNPDNIFTLRTSTFCVRETFLTLPCRFSFFLAHLPQSPGQRDHKVFCK